MRKIIHAIQVNKKDKWSHAITPIKLCMYVTLNALMDTCYFFRYILIFYMGREREKFKS